MAAREFHGLIKNEWENPLFHSADDVDGGDWQDPWYPSRVPGAGKINPQEEGEWRSESDGVMTGTSGWARWGVRVHDDINDVGPDGLLGHAEFIQVNWGIPFYGAPNITFAVFRNKPDDPGAFAPHDPRPPTLEIVGTSLNGETVTAQLEIVPYVFALPWSWALPTDMPTHFRAAFTVRRRASAQARSPLTFPNVFPSQQTDAMHSFVHRADIATRNGFVGGFPNFYEATYGLNHVGGTIFIKSAAAEWRDVPLAELGNVSLEDFEERIRVTNAYASRNGFVGGFPNFYHADYGSGIVCGTILLKQNVAEWRDVLLFTGPR